MPKNFRKFRDFEYDDDRYEARRNKEEFKQRRQIKRLKNAIKTQNINSTSDSDDVYER